MNTESNMTPDCKNCRSFLPDLLLDSGYEATHPEVAAHLNSCGSCGSCRTELSELRATFAALDEFHAPEPSPFFDTRLHARLREEVAAQPEGFWERMRSYLLFSTGHSFRPAVAGALALVLAAGGASFVGFHNTLSGSSSQTASSTVDDLKVLDNNASAEQQMGQLLDQSGAEDGDSDAAS